MLASLTSPRQETGFSYALKTFEAVRLHSVNKHSILDPVSARGHGARQRSNRRETMFAAVMGMILTSICSVLVIADSRADAMRAQRDLRR